MIGFGPEDSFFVLELTYNYGIKSYAKGNDLVSITVSDSTGGEILKRAEAAGLKIEKDSVSGLPSLTSPDGYRFLVTASGNRTDVVEVSLNVSSLSRASEFYQSVTQMVPGVSSPESKTAVFNYPDSIFSLKLHETGSEIDRGKAFGRIAIGVFDPVEPYFERATHFIKNHGKGAVLNEPFWLDTPGKCKVQVSILADPDDHEICIVGAKEFFELADNKGDIEKSTIHWEARKENGGL